MAQLLIETCDRCGIEEDNLPGDIRIHMGGRTFGSTHCYDLCAACLAELREFLHTQPHG
jgi:hypothetical protein